MQSMGEAIGSLSSGFKDFLGAASTSQAELTEPKAIAANDPGSQLQAWGKKFLESLKQLGWPTSQPVQLQFSNTGRISIPSDPNSEQVLQSHLQNSPELLEQLRSITDALAQQYEMRSSGSVQNSPLNSLGQWNINVSQSETSWSWIPEV
ncbi:MAG: hypothetical protein RLY14_1566 [Planctomycetota bacterium]